MTIAVDMGRKATKTNKLAKISEFTVCAISIAHVLFPHFFYTFVLYCVSGLYVAVAPFFAYSCAYLCITVN